MLSRYLFENPWPIVILSAVAAAFLAYRGLTEGSRSQLRGGAVAAAVAVVVLVVAALVTTPSEHAAATVRSFVAKAEAADVDGMIAMLAPTASLSYGRPENPGFGREDLVAALRTLEGRYRIEGNAITQLDANGTDATGNNQAAAVVLLTNRTAVAGFGDVPNSWWIKVARQPDGGWQIERLAFLRVAAQTPTPGIWR
jgi:hypothetical protein